MSQKMHNPRRGFTIIETLIVIGVIILLLSILLVATNKAVQAAQSANTKNLLNGMARGLVQFHGDVGYYPPVLGPLTPGNAALPNQFRDLKPPPALATINDTAAYRAGVQDWYSITTAAEYLVGYGHHYEDGYGVVPGEGNNLKDWDAGPAVGGIGQAESPALGIRHPGPDGVWGATVIDITARGAFQFRMQEGTAGSGQQGTESLPSFWDNGAVLGPYLEITDERLLGSIDGTVNANGDPNVYFPGDPGFDPSHPKVVVDYWGTPIRYFRRPYPPGALDQQWHPSGLNHVPTLSDFFVLRPWDIAEGGAVDGLPDNNTGLDGDTSTTTMLTSGEFALLSAGPDKALDPTVRYDDEDYNDDGIDFSNRDNIVEIGP